MLEPGGVLPIACKTRRASRCPPCAEVYRADTYQFIRAGLTGGKGIPATVAQHPCVFATLTAPTAPPRHNPAALGNAGPRRRRLGHADPSITLRVYAHVIHTAEAAAAEIFAGAVKAA